MFSKIGFLSSGRFSFDFSSQSKVQHSVWLGQTEVYGQPLSRRVVPRVAKGRDGVKLQWGRRAAASLRSHMEFARCIEFFRIF